MKNTLSCAEIRSQYIQSLLVIEKSNLDGEYKIGNREGKKIIKLFKLLEEDIDLAKEVLPSLFDHESVKVKTCAAAHCLALKIFEQQAVDILEEIAKLNVRVFSFEAEMTLEVWREKGDLQVYKK